MQKYLTPNNAFESERGTLRPHGARNRLRAHGAEWHHGPPLNSIVRHFVKGEMKNHPIALLIEKADKAINQEDFDTVVDLYTEDAVLVIKPGRHAVGKVQIRSAMEAIAAHFNRSLDVRQAGMVILETGDTALVLAKTLVSAKNVPVIERKATYVFKKDTSDRWLCAIDNSYGHEVLDASA